MNSPGNRDALLARYREGPIVLERAIADLQDADLDAPPSQGGWTIRQIVHHIVDGDDIWKGCIKMAIGNERAEFALAWYWAQPQDIWANRWAYRERSLDVSMALLRANREHILQLMEHIPDGWSRSVGVRKSDGEIEQVSVGFVVEMQADHVLHHVNRILAIRRERGGTPE
jgi:uncharacterized damage-inducible protein DinB